MLESVFIFMGAIAFVLFVLGIGEQSKVYCAMSTILWIIVMANALYIEVPADTSYTEWGFSAFCLAFIFANLVYLIAMQFDWRRRFFE